MKHIAITAAFLAGMIAGMPAISHASDPWSRQDVALESVYIVLSAIDMGQTLDIKNHPGYTEMNPLLGKHPSDDRIKTFFAFTRILHVLVVDQLPSSWRPIFQGFGIGEEAAFVFSNNYIGLRVNF